VRTPVREVWEIDNEADIIELETKNIRMESAKQKIDNLLKNNPDFTEEEFWHFYANRSE
jgi:hypothetical protein